MDIKPVCSTSNLITDSVSFMHVFYCVLLSYTNIAIYEYMKYKFLGDRSLFMERKFLSTGHMFQAESFQIGNTELKKKEKKKFLIWFLSLILSNIVMLITRTFLSQQLTWFSVFCWVSDFSL